MSEERGVSVDVDGSGYGSVWLPVWMYWMDGCGDGDGDGWLWMMDGWMILALQRVHPPSRSSTLCVYVSSCHVCTVSYICDE